MLDGAAVCESLSCASAMAPAAATAPVAAGALSRADVATGAAYAEMPRGFALSS